MAAWELMRQCLTCHKAWLTSVETIIASVLEGMIAEGTTLSGRASLCRLDFDSRVLRLSSSTRALATQRPRQSSRA